ncbi:DUF461 domain-containing protein [Streptomyces durbertensis]|uniref:DUF461 domain-containing protein n=1 Tax=Streptomyces durbertensis TaxID=2448886 RepID=A0ABR6EHL9_9ACTN|nr:DUF461 domain-containing protein [Streptomyces durbertensis]MBB1244834.1 DUF461 domain-containing protein [Streptomyces durbertensis]
MSSSLRRGVVAATVIALSTLSLGACGAGFNAQTNEVRPSSASVSVDNIKIQNIVVITPEEGEGPAAVTARIFNGGNEDETLRSITVEGAGDIELTPAEGGELVVPAGGSLMLGGEGNASAVVSDPKDIADGNEQRVTFELSETGKLSTYALVVPATRQYADWGPTPQASPADEKSGDKAGEDGRQDETGEGAGQDGEQDAGQDGNAGDGAESQQDAQGAEGQEGAGEDAEATPGS